jgi:hypothetical protein
LTGRVFVQRGYYWLKVKVGSRLPFAKKEQIMELPIYQVDAFADAVFKGNPAAIVPLET